MDVVPGYEDTVAARADGERADSQSATREQPAAPPSPTGLRWRAAKAPLTAIGVAVTGAAMFTLTDPHEGSVIPPCLLLTATGLDCPFCGGSRAVHDVFRGNIAEAADHNLLVVIALPLVAVGLVWWLWSRLRSATRSGPELETPHLDPPAPSAPSGVRRLVRSESLVLLGVLFLVAFAVARNLPSLSYLGSGLS